MSNPNPPSKPESAPPVSAAQKHFIKGPDPKKKIELVTSIGKPEKAEPRKSGGTTFKLVMKPKEPGK